MSSTVSLIECIAAPRLSGQPLTPNGPRGRVGKDGGEAGENRKVPCRRREATLGPVGTMLTQKHRSENELAIRPPTIGRRGRPRDAATPSPYVQAIPVCASFLFLPPLPPGRFESQRARSTSFLPQLQLMHILFILTNPRKHLKPSGPFLVEECPAPSCLWNMHRGYWLRWELVSFSRLEWCQHGCGLNLGEFISRPLHRIQPPIDRNTGRNFVVCRMSFLAFVGDYSPASVAPI